ncbi:hypothetical protein L596_024167 [Steinernema carpocapsae]|uniref:Uncharacterized protein n=1 Tax=Steinernema carpocapsae TaxID=34508 RepID=A0A4V5ZZM9_STECR|nr:hypothetical protein L596_024167 [Steinernema carpocapsae]
MERANYNVARWRRRPEEQQKQIEKVSDKGRRGCPQIAGCKHAIGAREASPALQRIDENRKPIDRRPEEKRRRMWTRCRLVGPGGVEEEVPAGIRPGIARRTEQVHEDKPRAFGATCWNAPLQRDFFNFGKRRRVRWAQRTRHESRRFWVVFRGGEGPRVPADNTNILRNA